MVRSEGFCDASSKLCVLLRLHLQSVYGVQEKVWSEELPHKPISGNIRYGNSLKGGVPTASSRGKRFWLALSKSVCWLRGERSWQGGEACSRSSSPGRGSTPQLGFLPVR